MTENAEKLDIAQRIVEIMQRTSEPLPTAKDVFDSSHIVIGTVPMHLRHLHNLLAEVVQEKEEVALLLRDTKERYGDKVYQDKVAYQKVNDAYQCLFEANVLCKAIFYILKDALRHHFHVPESGYTGIKISTDWQVATCKEKKEKEIDFSDCAMQ